MPTTALVAIPEDLQKQLQDTVFWRSDMRRTLASSEDVYAVARTLSPDLVVLADEGDKERVRQLIEQLRREPVTHDAVVVVFSRDGRVEDFERGGPSVVLPESFSGTDDGGPWHAQLEDLLKVRQRRENRVLAEFPVRMRIQGSADRAQELEAVALNVSSRGMLLETPEVCRLGARAELVFTPPGGAPVAVVGEVVRGAETADGHRLAGVHFVVVRKDARIAIRDFLRAQRPAGADDSEDDDRG